VRLPAYAVAIASTTPFGNETAIFISFQGMKKPPEGGKLLRPKGQIKKPPKKGGFRKSLSC
jgi:hypothetical protein